MLLLERKLYGSVEAGRVIKLGLLTAAMIWMSDDAEGAVVDTFHPFNILIGPASSLATMMRFTIRESGTMRMRRIGYESPKLDEISRKQLLKEVTRLPKGDLLLPDDSVVHKGILTDPDGVIQMPPGF